MKKRLCLLCSVLQGRQVYLSYPKFKQHLKKCETKFKKVRGL